MSDERWIVTHATENGATRIWWVDEKIAARLNTRISEQPSSISVLLGRRMLAFSTITGAALIWLTPGQSLTVEKSNG